MYSSFLDKILLPLGSLLFSGNYSRYLKIWKEYDRMDAASLKKTQEENLSSILEYAVNNVPYYKNLELSERPVLEEFPILTKEILRKESDRLISEKFKKKHLEKNHSSGSSGQQSTTYMTYDHKFFLRALQTHWWKWGGYKPGEYLLQAGISPHRSLPKKLKDIFFRTQYFNAFTLTTDAIKKVLKKTKNKAPMHLAGYPSALNEIALVAISKKEGYDFESVISYGDKLFDHHVSNFKKAFKNPLVINTYGCAEGLLIACKLDLPYYYIMSPHVFVEVVDDNGIKVKDGERGSILVTCLTNKAMPLIRYKLGDQGVLLPKNEYPETRKFQYPLLKEVTGRETDVIKAPNGNVLIVHSFTGILEYYDQIKQFKVVQTSIDSLVIEYLTDTRTRLSKEVENSIHQKLLSLVDHSMDISFQLVETILPAPSGKPQIIEIRSMD